VCRRSMPSLEGMRTRRVGMDGLDCALGAMMRLSRGERSGSLKRGGYGSLTRRPELVLKWKDGLGLSSMGMRDRIAV
jgi:hypothetical protein